MSSPPVERDIERDAADLSREKKTQQRRRINAKKGNKFANNDIDGEGDVGGTENDANFRTIYESLVETAKGELIHTDETDKDEKILNTTILQRIVLFHLQARIIKQTGELVNLRFEGKPLDQLQKDLAKYGTSHAFSHKLPR